MADESAGTGIELARELAGKYMTFKLADEEYGVPILKVREIIGLMDITRVPRTPHYIKGVINLRGKVIPVVDLKLKFGMGETEPTDQTVIIVLYVYDGEEETVMGILVDEVLEVLDIHEEEVEPTPALGDGGTVDFIMGIGKIGDRVVFLLDIDKALFD